MQTTTQPPEAVAASNRPTLRQLLVDPAQTTSVQFFRYVLVGGLAFAVDFGTLFSLTSLVGIHYLWSSGWAFLLGLTANYLLSRAWVFPRRVLHSATLEFAVFAAIGLAGLGLNQAGMWFLSGVVGLHYLVSKICTTVVVFFWNFFARKLSLFR